MKSIFRSTPRSRRARPQQHEAQAEPQNAFFQPKLTINAPGDEYEREADAVADQVVSQQGRGGPALNGQAAVQRKPISRVQRLATPEEDKMPSTNDGRMAEDKRIQEKPEVQRAGEPKEEEKPVQKMDAPKEEEKPVQKAEAPKEEEKPVQRMDAPQEEEKPIQKAEAPKEEDKPVQKMDAPKEEEKPVQKAGEEEELQTKAQQGGASQAAPNFSSRLSARKGGGSPLPAPARAQMEQGIGADFSQVRIHTDSEAAQMNKEIHAQAFTHGKDVYFNNGKFSPESAEGKRLLAHELTHVVQQNGGQSNDIQRDISTPLPRRVRPNRRTGIARTTINGIRVIILPDSVSEVAGNGAETSADWNSVTINYETDSRGRIKSFTGPAGPEVTIHTVYEEGADPNATSAYGRGTTAADQRAGNTSLRFHEGSHGTAVLDYIRSNPFPVFTGRKKMAEADFQQAMGDYLAARTAYIDAVNAASAGPVDCVGTPGSMC